VAAGLLFVDTDPGTAVSEPEFHDWYDNEHGPARLTVPGFLTGYRYQAADDLIPPWLALYDLDSPAVLDTPEYQKLVTGASDRERSIMSRLADHGTLDRRVYELISSDGDDTPARPAPTVLSVAMSVPAGTEDDLAAWYTDEHIRMLLAVPGWRRIRRFRHVAGPGPDFLSLHELDGPEALTEDSYRAAISTPWRDRIVASAVHRERRAFAFRNAFTG
jgi:hypothetical protein